MTIDRESAGRLQVLATALARVARGTAISSDPSRSGLTMGSIYPEAARSYTAARDGMSSRLRNRPDELFQQWLYLVYDPLAALAAYFGARASEAAHRMRRGTGARVNEAEILGNAIAEWNERVYGPEDRPWLAWLLRLAPPEEMDLTCALRNAFVRRACDIGRPALDARCDRRGSNT